MKLIGFQYLQKTLGSFVEMVYSSKKSCEVDPSRLDKSEKIEKNRENLVAFANQAWIAIKNSTEQVPRFTKSLKFIQL